MIQFPSPKERLLPEQIRINSPSPQSLDPTNIDRFTGSLLGMAIGDALGASVEFRPKQYLVDHPVKNMQSGGTWGLKAGQWTDDTSMALCLAASLLSKKGFDPYDQLVRYKWWYKYGYLSSTGQCFDIGNATRNGLEKFISRQNEAQRQWGVKSEEEMDNFSYADIKRTGFDVFCGAENANGNGALMRLVPVPLFFYRHPEQAVELSGQSARLTHGDQRAIDACRYYGALIVAALRGESKEQLLSPDFYTKHRQWFGNSGLHSEVLAVANGSYRTKKGYNEGIRGSGKSVQSLEAALWAFYNDNGSFKTGVLEAVNLGDDTDTTGAIYGQLAGAYYGKNQIPSDWTQQLYARELISRIAEWLQVIGSQYSATQSSQQQIPTRIPQPSQQQMVSRMSQPLQTQQYPYQNTRQNPSTVVTNPAYQQSLIDPSHTKNPSTQYNTPSTKTGTTNQYYGRGKANPQQHSSPWSWYRQEQ